MATQLKVNYYGRSHQPGGVCYHAKIDVPSQIALKIWDEGSGPGILRPLVERIEKMGKRLLDDGLHYVRYAFHLDCLEICVECGTSSGLYKSEFHSFIEWVKVFDLEGPVA